MTRRRGLLAALAIVGSALFTGSAWAGSHADTNMVNLCLANTRSRFLEDSFHFPGEYQIGEV